MSKKLYRVAVDAAQPVLDSTAPRKPVNITIEAPNERKALEQAKLAIMQNPEAAEKYKGKVVVNLEDFNALPVTEKAAIAPLSESRSAKKAAEGLKSGEQGRIMIEPHKLTVEGEKVAWPAFNVNDPKHKAIGMEHANAGHLIQKGDATVRPQNMTILPNFLEKALSDDSSRLRPLGRFLGIADDMDSGVAGWANNKGWFKRGVNTTKTNLLPAAGIELLSSKLTPQDDGSGGKENGEWLSGNGYVMRPAKALAEMAGVRESDEDRANERQGVLNRIAAKAKTNKPMEALSRISMTSTLSKPALDDNSQRIAASVGDKSENGLLAHRTFAEAVRENFVSARGDTDQERVSNATRMMFERKTADEIVEALKFGSKAAEKKLYDAQSAKAIESGGAPKEFKSMAQSGFAKYLAEVEADNPKTPYITFPTSMTTSFHQGVERTGFRVKHDLGDNYYEDVFVVPVIVPRRTASEVVAGTHAGKQGDLDAPDTLGERMKGKYEVIYLKMDARGPTDKFIPADKIKWSE